MVELVKKGYLTDKDIQGAVVELIDLVLSEEEGLMGIYKKGYTLLLTTQGLEIAGRERRWEHRMEGKGSPIMQVLTVEELADFVEENNQYIKQGKAMATIQVIKFKLEELLDDVYEGNYEEMFVNIKAMRGNM